VPEWRRIGARIVTAVVEAEVSEENKAFVRRWVELLQGTDLQTALNAIDEHIAPDFVNHSSFGLPPDKEGVKMFFQMFWTGASDWKTTIHQLVAEGDKVVTHKTASGTHTGEFLGVPATGRHMDMHIMDILTIRDGMVYEHTAVVDVAGLMQQLGAMPG
jgi:steroid delta-isomerase-like uncharacterized protein